MKWGKFEISIDALALLCFAVLAVVYVVAMVALGIAVGIPQQ